MTPPTPLTDLLAALADRAAPGPLGLLRRGRAGAHV